MICFLESWTRTAFVAAIMMAVIPVITFAQTTDTRGENASTPTGGTPTPPVSDTAADAGRFYFVTGVVFDWSEETRFQDKNCASTSPAALYGCGNGLDGTPFGARGDFGTMTGFDLGFGYAMTPALRLEALIEYHPSFSFKGLSNFIQTTDRQDVSADLSSLHGVLAAYWDLTEVGLPRLGPLSRLSGVVAACPASILMKLSWSSRRRPPSFPAENRLILPGCWLRQLQNRWGRG